ncbi:MAG: ABC transporter ATP-binding protein [Butyricicoccus sp.]|nr:ABC transporter ATP-binding protein [Butyricicoccus sp.]
MLRMENVCKTYDKGRVHALQNIDLHVPPGAYLSVTGASGSGKTTLLHILGCLLRPSSGAYHLNGTDVCALSERERTALRAKEIGFVFQDFRLIPRMNVIENVALPLTFRGVSREEREARAVDALCMVGLGHRLRHAPAALSGGQQQRAAIARALCTDPMLLLADEPTGNLDPQAAAEVLALFDRLHENGKTIVLITHDQKAAARASRSIRIENGRIV